MAIILDGKKTAESLKGSLKKEFKKAVKLRAITPKLGSIVISDDATHSLYAHSQRKICDEFGIEYILKEAPANATLEKISTIINTLKAQNVTGIMVQLPLPKSINHLDIIKTIGADKDAECLHPANIGRLFSANYDLLPCVPAAVMELLKQAKIKLYGKEAVIIGHSYIVGKPLSILLLNNFCTVTVCHIATKLLQKHIAKAEILISAVGAEGFEIPGAWIKKGATIIDVATKKYKGKVTGDVDFESARKKAAYITPVPGGVGPVTNVMLVKNLLQLYKRQK